MCSFELVFQVSADKVPEVESLEGPENTMLSEMSQSEKEKLSYDFTPTWNLMNKLN